MALSMMKVLYDMEMEGSRSGDALLLLERTMRRELLYDCSALDDMKEDLSCSIIGYLTQGIITNCHHLDDDVDPSTAMQHVVQTSSALHAGLRAITRILPTATTATASTAGLVDSCLVDFITSFIDYLSVVTTRPSATICMLLPVHTKEQLLSILVQCVRIIAGRLRPTAIRTLGGTSDKAEEPPVATVSSSSTGSGGGGSVVLLAGLDAVTSFLLQQSTSRSMLSLLTDNDDNDNDDNDDARRKVDLFCTLHECIMILNGSISCVLQHHDNIIPSLDNSCYHRDAMGHTSSDKYPLPVASKRAAANSITAPSIAYQRSTFSRTSESLRDDDHPHHQHTKHHHHHHGISELEVPYRGTMVLYFLYENRRYLNSLRCFVASVLAFQSSHCSSSSSSRSPIKHGILSSAASIEKLLLSVANSVSGGVVSLSRFSSMLLVTNFMTNLPTMKSVTDIIYPSHLLLLSVVDFICSMQGIVLQCVETARRCEVSCFVEEQMLLYEYVCIADIATTTTTTTNVLFMLN